MEAPSPGRPSPKPEVPPAGEPEERVLGLPEGVPPGTYLGKKGTDIAQSPTSYLKLGMGGLRGNLVKPATMAAIAALSQLFIIFIILQLQAAPNTHEKPQATQVKIPHTLTQSLNEESSETSAQYCLGGLA